jgi:hypothetical protein
VPPKYDILNQIADADFSAKALKIYNCIHCHHQNIIQGWQPVFRVVKTAGNFAYKLTFKLFKTIFMDRPIALMTEKYMILKIIIFT